MIASYVKEHVLLAYNTRIRVAGEITNSQELLNPHLNLLQAKSSLNTSLQEHKFLMLTCMLLPDLVAHRLQRGTFNGNADRLVTLISICL
ncbi:hypothetical protein KSD_49270 [Ktedonobacter sp. SOSP1-85]|nr:hypothetical protein KSD_49270 [Ktedonobacter sp. SOSP1-85]